MNLIDFGFYNFVISPLIESFQRHSCGTGKKTFKDVTCPWALLNGNGGKCLIDYWNYDGI
jgi:hypothetical protein